MRNKKGSALITVIMITIVLLLLSSGLISVASGTTAITNSINTDKTFFWEAESGINIGLKVIKNLSYDKFKAGVNYSKSKTYALNNNSVTVKIEKIILNEFGSVSNATSKKTTETWQITSTVTDGSKVVKTIRLRNLNPKVPGYFTAFLRCNMDLYDNSKFTTADAFYGPAHFEGLLKIAGTPRFYGSVTTASKIPSRGFYKKYNSSKLADYSIYYDDGSTEEYTKLKDIFANSKYADLFGKGIWDIATSSHPKIKDQAEMDNKYFGDNGMFKAGYKPVDSKDVPAMFEDFATIEKASTTLRLDKVLGLNSSDVVRIVFNDNANTCDIEKRKNDIWEPVISNQPLLGCKAISIPESFENNLYVKGQYQQSMSIITEKSNIVVDGDLYPKGLDTTKTNISALQKDITKIKPIFALMSGMNGLQDPLVFGNDKTVGNIFIGQENSNNDDDILVAAGLFAYGVYGVAKKDIGSSGEDENETGFGKKFKKIISVRLLGNIMMGKKGLFRRKKSGVYKGINTTFAFDPRANQFLLPPHIKPVLSKSGEFTINASNAIWEVL